MSTKGIRLIFEYDGDQVRLVSQQPVDMVITGFDLPRAERPGYYVETRDAGGLTLAKTPARNAFATSAEVFPEKPGESFERVKVAKPQGSFTVVVPATENADHVAVMQVTPGTGKEPGPASTATSRVGGMPEVVEIGKFQLDKGEKP